MNNLFFLTAIGVAGVLLGGCTPPGSTAQSPSQPVVHATARRVEMVNLTTRTQAANPSSLSVEQFVSQAAQLCRDGKLGRLHRFVQRYPDVALEMLRNTGPQSAADGERQAVAQAYDRLFVSPQESQRWHSILKDMAARPDAYQPEFGARSRARSFIEQGRFAAAIMSDSSGQSTLPPYLRADALRLRGIALFLNNQHAQAAAAWQQATGLAQTDTCVCAELDLLVSDALKKAGQPAESVVAWNQAASQSVELHDPILWERLIELKPLSAAWPKQAHVRILEQIATQPSASEEDDFGEGAIWHQTAQWRLERNEASAALLAFAEAQTWGSSARAKGEARIGQARALVAMGQNAPAMAILSAVVEEPDAAVSCHALAVVGVINLQQGRTPEGFNMLQRAVENPDHTRWSGFSLAQADLAVTYLAAGKEKDGLRVIHEAQDAFRTEGRVADLCQSLANEATYLQKAGHVDLAESKLKKIAELENLPPSMNGGVR
jgi:tetratricopeptide (TPR) repeat protein